MVKKIVAATFLLTFSFSLAAAADYQQFDRPVVNSYPAHSENRASSHINISTTGNLTAGDLVGEIVVADPGGGWHCEGINFSIPGIRSTANNGPTIFDTPGMYENLRPKNYSGTQAVNVQNSTNVQTVNGAVANMPETARRYFLPQK